VSNSTFSVLVPVGILLSSIASAADNDLYARVVLFMPESAEPAAKYEERLASLAVRAEAFFAHWMRHWKRPVGREQIFARDENGAIDVCLARGAVDSRGRDALAAARRQAIEGAVRQLGLGSGQQPVVWWIFYDYPGIKGFQGGAQGMGGAAINAYPKGTGLIPADAELAAPDMADMAIKGTIHEFGHALGLPHIGPRPGLGLGNSLMGPINRAYWGRTGTQDPRVHLTEAAAALLCRHPIFQRETTGRPKVPQTVEVRDLRIAESDDGAAIVVEGTFSGSIPAHTAVLLDSERGRFGDYWKRSYSGTIDAATGVFRAVVAEPFGRGSLFLAFCFENGFNTGDGRMPFLRGSSIRVSYSGEKGSRRLDSRVGAE
jgi:hypothetical protein